MKSSVWRYLWKSQDIRRKLLISLLLLGVFRLAANIPVPGIDREVLGQLTGGGQSPANLIGFLDLLTGGTLSNFSILSMSVYPYITAQIVFTLAVPIFPSLQSRIRDNPREGQALQERWTILLTIPMAALSAFGQIQIFTTLAGRPVIPGFGLQGASLLPSLAILVAMMAGTLFAIWIGQLISEYGIPKQGLSLIIFAGIVARIPANLLALLSDRANGWWMLPLVVVFLSLVIFAIVLVQQGRRNVPVLFPGRRIGSRVSMPVHSHLPLMVNMAGMIPLIFAQTFLTLPALITSPLLSSKVEWLANLAAGVQGAINRQNWIYAAGYFALVVVFSFYYTDVIFQQQDYGENLKRQGAQVPGVVRGEPTQRYLRAIQQRITLPGSLLLGLVAVLPNLMRLFLPAGAQAGLFLISTTGLLIVVGVVRDTVNIIEAELKVHGYEESLLKP